VLLLALGCGGCGPAGKGNVSGQVTFKGKPLPLGSIAFYAQEGNKDVVTSLIRNGAYAVEGVPAGPAKITVMVVDPAKAGGGGKAANPKKGGDSAATGPAEAAALPERYRHPDQSGLTYTVTRGDQTHNLVLQP
jgi:hypothetical protein